MASALITRERAQRNLLAETTFTAEQLLTIDTLIGGVSAAIENYCKRKFQISNYDELYNGGQFSELLLRHYPIISVERVMYSPNAVITITNTSSANQQARVKTTSAGVTLTHVASGTTTPNTLAFATYTTISALKTAINALGSGWAATIPSSTFENYPTADIRNIQGAMGALNQQAALRIHTAELSSYEVNAKKGVLLKGSVPPQHEEERAEWYGGPNYWRVIYTAGYEELPWDIQEACAQWVAGLYYQAARDPSLQYQSVAGGSTYNPYGFIPPMVIELLRPYRRQNITSPGE